MAEQTPIEELISGAAQDAGGWLGALPVAQVATGADGKIVRWNHAAQDLLGYLPPQVLGRHIADLLHPGADRSLGRALWETAATGRGVMGTVTAWHREGYPLELEIWACPMPDRREGASAVLVFAADAHSARRIRGSSAVWDGLFARSPVGIAVLDTQLRFLRVNPALEAMNGLEESSHLGRRLAEVLPEVNASEMEEAMRQVLSTGEPLLDRRRRGRTPADPGHDRAWSCSYVRMEDPAGLPIGVIASLVDITEQQRDHSEAEAGRRRLALLSQASVRLGASLDLERTAQELADLAVPPLADVVTVDVLETLARGEEPGRGLAGGVELRRLGKSPLTGAALIDVLAPLGRTLTFPRTAPYTQALSVRQPYLLAHFDNRTVGPGARGTDSPEQLLRTGVHSLMMVPLIARDLVLGVATFYRTRAVGSFGSDDVILAGELAARAAVSIDNARLYQHEHETAVLLQRSMLPQHITPPPGIEVAHRYLPASDINEVGGDWYDVLQLPGGRAALLMGDVMGHGIAAAAVMGRLAASVRVLARLDLPPTDMLHLLEAVLADLTEPMLTSFLYIVCDPLTGECTVTRAGHPPAATVAPNGTVRLVHSPPGVPLGVGGIDFTTTRMTLPLGSLLVLYTDGLIEARGSDIDERLNELTRLLADPHRPLNQLCDTLITSLVPASADDDVALLIARIGSPP
ncbi:MULTISPECIES: SpoIIE family protein phosphatase [unclassified Streptomyces]|uniref:SpoIIE family protein phosphatase n=1 Tax=unclassified Streptomyces TaxID=2593676 RepID=UPI001BE7C16B|nr:MULTISPECIES: SpoIIE family protein phosphatase [unclassified Streptomyces]MBT2407632.1 SpoIIE family protein phosphatase [Streptomyces sp. ISL-21]MBT2454509.1 SpoIIE family protein phosphatase [Streptomyces sp. ISL-86]MBT2611626.1 SpoIIE family protein phosphatase [Streptomyces sp. ISL-87]